jgi:ribosome-binding factor A
MGKRKERVASLIHREVAELLQRRMKDPRLEALTVTRVELSPDLHYAWVYVDFASRPGDLDAALGALEGASRFLRNEIRNNLRLRHTPELVFRSDRGLAHSERVQQLLSELRDRGELQPIAPADAGDGLPDGDGRGQDEQEGDLAAPASDLGETSGTPER